MPPDEKNGSDAPVTGNRPVTTPIFRDYLKRNLRRKARDEQGSRNYPCTQRDIVTADNKRRENNQDQRAADKAKLLADDGENKVVLRFRQEQMLLAALAEANSTPHPAGTQRVEGL